MRKLLVMFLMLLPYVGKAQYCSAATSNLAITVTTVTQNSPSYTTGIRAFNFAATAGCIYTFSCCGLSTMDTYLRLYSTGTGGTLLATNDDFCGLQSQLTWTCPTTGTYSILLTRFSCVAINSATRMSYIKSCPVVPPNDNCSNTIAILTLPYTSPVTTNVASTDDVPTSTSGCGTQGSNLWYTVVGDNTTFTATTCNASTNFDTEVRVYTGNCSSLNSMVEIICNDDDATCVSSGLYSTVSWCALYGTTYYISVGYFASGVGTGNFVLGVSSNNTPCSTLPVELTWFDGWDQSTTIKLQWETSSETNNDYFQIDKYDSISEWINLSRVNGHGTTSRPNLYETYDYTPHSGYNYYRLKQVDYNGQAKVYAPISVYKPYKNRTVKMYVNTLGQQIVDLSTYKGLYLIVYEDGSVEKRIR